MSFQSHKQKKVQKSKENKAIQKEITKVNKQEYLVVTGAFNQQKIQKVEKTKQPIKSSFKCNKNLKQYADQDVDEDLFAAYKTKPDVNSAQTQKDIIESNEITKND